MAATSNKGLSGLTAREPHHGAVSAGKTPWRFIVAAIALIAAAPLMVALGSLFAGDADTWAHLVMHVLPEATVNTAFLVAGVAGITFVLGVSLAWLIAVCDFPGRSFFSWALLLPMAIPGYVLGFALLALFEYTGPLQTSWRDLFADIPFPGLGSRGASIVTLSLALYPYVYLIVREAFSSQGVRGLEVAQSVGMSSSEGFFRVSLPMARPWVVGGLSLAVMECLADFGTVKLFNYETFTTAIYEAWFGLFSLQAAQQLSLVVVAFVLLALLAERRARGHAQFVSQGGSATRRRLSLSGMPRVGAVLLCSLVLGIAFVAPTAQLVVWAIESLGTEFEALYGIYIRNSLLLATMAAILILTFSLLLSFATRNSGDAISGILARLATVGYAIPGTVLAVGFFVPVAYLSRFLTGVFFGFEEPTGVVALQGGLLVILLAYSARFLAVAHNPVDSAMQRIRPSIEDAARGMGVAGLSLFPRLYLPILRPALLTGLLLVFVDVMKELPITLMTRPFGWDTLAVRVFQLTTEGEWERAALPSLAIVAAGLIPVIILSRRSH
ncbi:MAG TPA: iron ABC transporter permease [Woeseiaceae bacterium]